MDREIVKRLLSSIILIPIVYYCLVAGSFLFNQGDLIKATNTLSEKFN